jgi:hypothetical protein
MERFDFCQQARLSLSVGQPMSARHLMKNGGADQGFFQL